jgi:heme-degrading monooxygenase HmoA
MYSLFTMFTLGPNAQQTADKLGENFSTLLKGLKGYKSLTMFRNDDTGECGGLSLWESKEDAEAALETTGSALKDALGDVVKERPKRGVYEVWRIDEAD